MQKWQSARLKLLETRSRNGLLQEVYAIEQLLAQAKRDLTPAEDNRAARAWRGRAQQDIQEALSFMTRASALDKADDQRAGY